MTNISTLKNLRVLKLDGNKFEKGYISVSTLSSLRTLSLRFAGLNESSFPLSEELANLSELQILDLSANGFSNDIQGTWLCNLRNLRELDLSGNYFKGVIPTCLRNFTSLQILDLIGNEFGKELPELSNHKSLRYLDLSYNHFEDKLSLHSLANHSELQVLRLSGNSLQVQTEDAFWRPTFQLQQLYFGGCSLNKPHGTIPTFLSYQYNLILVDLSSNDLVGPFPTWLLKNNSHLQTLILRNNSLNGTFQLPHRHELEHLDISNNSFKVSYLKLLGLCSLTSKH